VTLEYAHHAQRLKTGRRVRRTNTSCHLRSARKCNVRTSRCPFSVQPAA